MNTKRTENRIATQIRIDAGLYSKVKAIATSDHRYINNQIEYILEKFVREYESEHGPINLEDNQ